MINKPGEKKPNKERRNPRGNKLTNKSFGCIQLKAIGNERKLSANCTLQSNILLGIIITFDQPKSSKKFVIQRLANQSENFHVRKRIWYVTWCIVLRSNWIYRIKNSKNVIKKNNKLRHERILRRRKQNKTKHCRNVANGFNLLMLTCFSFCSSNKL